MAKDRRRERELHIIQGPSLGVWGPQVPTAPDVAQSLLCHLCDSAAVPPEWTWGGGPVIWGRLLVQVQGEDSSTNSAPSFLGFHCRNSSSSLNALMFFELMPQCPLSLVFRAKLQALLVPFA